MNKAIPLAIAGALFVILIIILVVVLSRGGDATVQARSAAPKPAVAPVPKPTVASTPASTSASAPAGTTSAAVGTTAPAAKPAATAPAPVLKKEITGCKKCGETGMYLCDKGVLKKDGAWWSEQQALVSDFRNPVYDPVEPALTLEGVPLYWRELSAVCK
jgi:hypothetical protein